MPQFAVYPNTTPLEDALYLLQVQSSRLDQLRTRVIVPLIPVGPRSPIYHAMTPHLRIDDKLVFVDALNIATIHAKRLGSIVAILGEHDQDRVIRAIDEMISRA